MDEWWDTLRSLSSWYGWTVKSDAIFIYFLKEAIINDEIPYVLDKTYWGAFEKYESDN